MMRGAIVSARRLSTYRVLIDVTRIEDRQESGDPWDCWCTQMTPDGAPLPDDPRTVSLGASGDGTEVWEVTAPRPSLAARIVEQYARATGNHVSVISVDRVQS